MCAKVSAPGVVVPVDKKKDWKGKLWKAAAKGDLKALKKIVEKGYVDLNEFDEGNVCS